MISVFFFLSKQFSNGCVCVWLSESGFCSNNNNAILNNSPNKDENIIRNFLRGVSCVTFCLCRPACPITFFSNTDRQNRQGIQNDNKETACFIEL